MVLKDHKYQSRSYCVVHTQGRLFPRGLAESNDHVSPKLLVWDYGNTCSSLLLINVLIKTIVYDHQNNKGNLSVS